MDINAEDLAQQFASDNYAGICPEAWAAMENANRGHATAYEMTYGRPAPQMPFASCSKRIASCFLFSMERRPIRLLWLRFASRIMA